ncbi:hypothetical protein B0A53_05741 [Rhodotorula sp. CCFEE 5036]|nr:hypothetical protein B0A53_05741 [Rhodotorula sp. CCFEE 5036]
MVEGQQKRWQGWQTSTSTVWVTNTRDVPEILTVYTTYGESPMVDGGTTTETVYKGESTLTVLGPSYLTLTFYPTTTTYAVSRTTIPTATKTKTKDAQVATHATATLRLHFSACCFNRLRSWASTAGEALTELRLDICLAALTRSIVGIGIGWNLAIIRDFLFPCKTFTVGVHEVGHVLVTVCLGYRIGLFTINPKDGGLTRTKPAAADVIEGIPFAALPAGYVFSMVVGGLLTFCGFNTLASKVASFIVGLGFVAVFLWVDALPKLLTLATVGLMIGLWFVDHAWGLRFFILFLGVMNSFYVLWDVADDAFFAKQNPCCPALHFEAMPRLSPAGWTILYVAVSLLVFVGFILAALATWKQSPHAMYCQAQSFLPTR